MNNQRIGISTYDYRYGTCRCVYCNEPVILHENGNSAENTLNVFFQDEVDRRRGRYTGNDFYMTLTEEQELREQIREANLGQIIGYQQCIHYSCLKEVQQPENKEILEKIRLSNRQNMQLPDTEEYIFYRLNYSSLVQCVNFCAYCHRELNIHANGFAYCRKVDKQRKCLFLHDECYETLKEIRCHEKKLALQVRRNFLHLLVKRLSKRSSVEDVAARNEGWLSFLTQYELDFDERHQFNEFLQFVEKKKTQWPDKECEQFDWRHYTSVDLEELSRNIKLEQGSDEKLLATLEKELVTVKEPVYPFCTIPAPSSKISSEEMAVEGEKEVSCLSVNFKEPALPKQLHINLVRALRQRIREEA